MIQNGYCTLPLSALIVWGILSWIYLKMYNRYLDQALQNKKRRYLISPGKTSIILLVGVLTVSNIITSVQSRKYSEAYDMSLARDFTYFKQEADSPEELNAVPNPYSVYSAEENPGYRKEEVVQGDFTYIIFRSEIYHDRLHPDVIVYARYNGELEAECRLVSVQFDVDDEPKVLSVIMSEPKKWLRVFLSAEFPCNAVIRLDYLDEEGAYEWERADRPESALEKYTLLHESISIPIQSTP